jgi:hypothetical protein
MPYLRLVPVPHPVAGKPASEVAALAPGILADIVAALTTPASSLERQAGGSAASLHAGTIEVDGDDEGAAIFADRLWTDGLPVVLPTERRVGEMLAGIHLPISHEPDLVPPSRRQATLNSIAVNAVMAGCLPEYLPVVVAALTAAQDAAFNLLSLQTTTHPAGLLVVVNGPIRNALAINSRAGCFGPGRRANATIGRAVRLVLQNVGGARPGDGDLATHGQPAKYSYCVGENEEESPWQPLQMDRGYDRDTSTVTVIAAEGPHNVNDHSSTTPQGVLTTMVSAMCTLAANDPYIGLGKHQPLVVLGPEHAATIAEAGWTKQDVKAFLFAHARQPLKRLRLGGMFAIRDWPKWMEPTDDDALVPLLETPDDVLVIVAGGEGKHSLYVPTLGANRSVTVAISGCV